MILKMTGYEISLGNGIIFANLKISAKGKNCCFYSKKMEIFVSPYKLC